jgi:hypothetical protein
MSLLVDFLAKNAQVLLRIGIKNVGKVVHPSPGRQKLALSVIGSTGEE